MIVEVVKICNALEDVSKCEENAEKGVPSNFGERGERRCKPNIRHPFCKRQMHISIGERVRMMNSLKLLFLERKDKQLYKTLHLHTAKKQKCEKPGLGT